MKVVFGNFKKKLNREETIALLQQYADLICINKKSGFCVLPDFFIEAKQTVGKKLNLVIQNLSLKEIVSIKKFNGRNYKLPMILLGHSDYRSEGKESNSLVLKKVKLALAYGFNVVLCIGETIDDKGSGNTDKVILKQIAGLNKCNLENLTIAYEPVYAIGTGMIASKEDVEHVISLVKNKLAANVQVLYGGSVRISNAEEIFNYQGCDGVLVGGASLDYFEMTKIFELAK